MNYVTDTHTLVWFFTNDTRLGDKALGALNSAHPEVSIIIPTVVLAEMLYITKKAKIPLSFSETLRRIEDYENFFIASLDIDILKVADEIDFDMEMRDKLIVATALYFDALLITKDE